MSEARDNAREAPHVELRRVTKRYGHVTAISNVTLTVDNGSFTALLGPSGCGKSTLLRMIAGLEQITAGQCFIDGVDVTDTPPAKRRIAMVFQSYALYPHMTVRDNIAFSLSIAVRANFLAASASASLSAGPSSANPRRSSSTSHCRISTPPCASPCDWRSASSTIRSARR